MISLSVPERSARRIKTPIDAVSRCPARNLPEAVAAAEDLPTVADQVLGGVVVVAAHKGACTPRASLLVTRRQSRRRLHIMIQGIN
jgi:phage tail sheath gpL-like